MTYSGISHKESYKKLPIPFAFIQTSPFVVDTLHAMAHLPLLLVVFLSVHTTTTFAMEKSTPSLHRSPTGDRSFGNFKRNPFHYLWEKNITWSMVIDQLDCTFLCVGEPKCYSINVAAHPDSNGLYLCELLATDKYRATEKFHANATFHHYSPWVRNKMFLVYTFFSLVRVICSLTLNRKKVVLITKSFHALFSVSM